MLDNNLAKILDYYYIRLNSTQQKIVCPFHNDVNASLLVDLEKGSWFCFGCQKGGDAFRFHSEYQTKMGNNNSFDILKQYNHVLSSTGIKNNGKITDLQHIISEEKNTQYYKQKMLEAKDYYYGLKSVDWEKAEDELVEYMEWRGFTRETLNKLKAKYTYQDTYQIVFPLLDNGRFKGWVARTFDKKVEKKRKYLYNKGFRRRYTLAGTYKSKTVMLVEGYMDMAKAKQLGIKNVAAILGWKITSWQIEKLKDSGVTTIISALDNDECGKKGTKELKKHFNVITFPYPKNVKDMGDMTEKQFKRAKQKVKVKLQKLNGGND